MKNLNYLLLPLLILSQTSCQNYSEGKKQALIISPNSAEAHMLALNEEDIAVLQENYPKVARKIHSKQPLKVAEILELHESGLTSETMIRILKYTSSKFNLNAAEVIYLQAEGLPYKVINFMIES